MLEKDIESAVCSYATQTYDMLAEKFQSPSRLAVPDRLFCGHGDHHFFIEFKATGKAKTVHKDASGHEGRQYRDHEKRRKRGHRVYVVDDIEEGKRIVDTEVQASRAINTILAQYRDAIISQANAHAPQGPPSNSSGDLPGS